MTGQYDVRCPQCNRLFATCEHGKYDASIITKNNQHIKAISFDIDCKCGFEATYTTVS